MKILLNSLRSIVSNPANHTKGEEVFGEYIHQGDLALIVGTTNSGKTLLASDIALANNDNLCHWDEPMNNIQRKTIYIDEEQNDSQVARRYEHLLTCSSGELIRGNFCNTQANSSMEARLSAIDELLCKNRDTKLLIIDNLMCMLDSATSVKQAKYFIQGLKRIKETFNLTVILVVHLNKHNGKKPIEIKNIMGSSVIANYADSIIAVGNSCKADNIKYLKQLKSRSSIKMSDVAVMEIVDEPYLHFEFLEYDDEENHLSQQTNSRSSITPLMSEMVLKLKAAGYSIRKIADELGLSKSAVGRFLAD